MLDSLDTLAAGGAAPGGPAAAARVLDATHSFLLSELCHLSYGCSKHRAHCGALELRQLVSRRDVAWLLPRELDLACAMLSLCVDGSVDCHPDTLSAATELLLATLRKCHSNRLPALSHASPSSAPAAPSCSQESVSAALVKRFATELSNASAGVRDASKAALRELALLSNRYGIHR